MGFSTRPQLNSLQRRRENNVKPRSRGTIKGTPIGGLSSAGTYAQHHDDLTVVTLNLTKNSNPRRPVAPIIATLADDDPSCNMQKPSLSPVYVENDGDIYKEGRDDIMIMSSINAVDIHRISWSPASDVQVEPVDVQCVDDNPDAI